MNAKDARRRSLRRLEPILWEQVCDEVREKIEAAVEGEEKFVSVDIELVPKGERGRTLSNLQILEFDVRMDDVAKTFRISW